MGHGNDNGIVTRLRFIHELHAVLPQDFIPVCIRVHDIYIAAVILELVHYIHYLGVSYVRNILLEGNAHHENP